MKALAIELIEVAWWLFPISMAQGKNIKSGKSHFL